jgi:Tfp pilus assembly protein PilE
VRRQYGFTLAEIMVALIVAMVVIGGVYLAYLMGLRSWQEGSAVAALERSAGFIMDKICRGPHGRFGLREATPTTVQVSENGQSVTYKVDKVNPPTPVNRDDTTCRCYCNGNRVWHDPDVDLSMAADDVPLHRFGEVETLNFSFLSPQRLKVDLTIADPRLHMKRRVSLRMTTGIFLRKSR